MTGEYAQAEREIRRKANEHFPELAAGQALAYALVAAGLIGDGRLLCYEQRIVGDEAMSEAEQLIGLVMVPGEFGLSVPLDLLLRSLGKAGITNFASLLSEIDVFRWDEDAIGNIHIRHVKLEARLFVQARLGGARTEIAFAKQLLLAVRDSAGPTDSPDVYFAVDLVRNIGDSGPLRAYFGPYLLDLASALEELRTKRGVQNPPFDVAGSKPAARMGCG